MNSSYPKGLTSRFGAGEKGSLLVTVLIFAGLGAILISAILSRIADQYKLAIRDYQSEAALYLAESGGQRALWELNYNNGSATTEWSITEELPTGSYVTTFDPTEPGAVIRSTGYTKEVSKSMELRLKTEMKSIFDNPICADGDVQLEDKDTFVDGDVYCTGILTKDPEAIITGDIYENAEIDFPPVNIGDWDDDQTGLPTDGNLNGRIWYTNANITIGSSNIISGPGVIVAAGQIKLEEGAQVGSSGEEVLLLSFSNISPAILLEGGDVGTNTTLYGIAYAPNGSIKIEDNAQIYGSIVSTATGVETVVKLETGGGATFYPVELSGLSDVNLPPGFRQYYISFWQEE